MRYLQFLPLLFWAVFAFGLLYSLLETKFKPLVVLAASFSAFARILTGRRRITAALFALFAAGPILELLSVFVLKLDGQRLLLVGLVCQAIVSSGLAWVATYIHGDTLPLPERGADGLRDYRVASSLAGLTILLIKFALTVGLSAAVVSLRPHTPFRLDLFVPLLLSVAFVPLSFIRPALSLGLPHPVVTALSAAAKPPFVAGLWVIALGLPAFAFNWIAAGIVGAHPSVFAVIAFRAAKVVFNVIEFTFLEATTLLLLARQTNRFSVRTKSTAPRSGAGSGPLGAGSSASPFASNPASRPLQDGRLCGRRRSIVGAKKDL